jgi:hypothetical protein
MCVSDEIELSPLETGINESSRESSFTTAEQVLLHLKACEFCFRATRVEAISHNPSKKQQLTNITMDDIIKLNVGGRLFATSRATLCAEAGSMLAAKFDPESNFAPPKELDGGVFLDRSPKAFHHVLDYLRNGCQVVFDIPDDLVKAVGAEADYFGLAVLKGACDIQLRARTLDKSKETDIVLEYTGECYDAADDVTSDLVRMMNYGWRIEKEVLEKDSKGKVAWYHFILSRPRQRKQQSDG